MKQSFRIADLIAKEIKGSISNQEKEELNVWVNESADNLAIYQKAIDSKVQLKKLEEYNSFNKENAWENIEKELFAPKLISLFSKKFLKYAAAFLIPLSIAGVASYYYLNQETELPLANLDEHVKPGVQKATLVLSNGESHILDQENPETDFSDSDAHIRNIDNSLSYEVASNSSTEFMPNIYNELITPKGGGYSLQLADGTNVWLNADSRLTFPVGFTDSTRHLFLEGEAYFEVAHNGSPFIVTSDDMDIRVMGTSFNISAYSNDDEKKTTLVEGKVRVDLHEETEVVREFLTPNKQAIIGSNNEGIKVSDVDATQYSSWVDGKFEFNNETLAQVMKKLARWYDFEYEFENASKKSLHFSGRLDNQQKVSTLLSMLEMTTNVKFKIEVEKIVIQ